MIQSGEESAASGLEIDTEGIFHAQAAHDYARRGGERIVGRGGGENQAFDFLRIGAGLFEQLLNGLACHVGRAETLLVEDAALLDSDARHDPLVVGVDHTRKFFVVEDVFGHESAHAGDNGIDFFHERRKKIEVMFVLCRCAKRELMKWGRLRSKRRCDCVQSLCLHVRVTNLTAGRPWAIRPHRLDASHTRREALQKRKLRFPLSREE